MADGEITVTSTKRAVEQRVGHAGSTEMFPLRLLMPTFLTVLIPFTAGVAYGQTYPSKPVRIITTASGGGNDFASRLVSPGLSAGLGQPVIVDNRASTLISIEAAAKSPPDGYSLTLQGALLWIMPLLEKVTYDAVRDFAPITLISTEPSVLAVHPSVPAKNVKELITLAKARPGELNYGAPNIGSSPYIGGELLKSMAKINMVWIPYKGSGAALTGLLSGEIQLYISDVGLLMPQVKSGRLRALAVTTTQPSALAPGLPTVAASGLPGYELVGMTGMWVPAGTPSAIINRLHQEMVRVLNSAEVREKVGNRGAEANGASPQQFAAIINSDMAKVSKLIKAAGIKSE